MARTGTGPGSGAAAASGFGAMPKPGAPERPEVFAISDSALRIVWSIPEAEPQVIACTVKVRIAGSQRWVNYDHATRRLVPKGGSTVPAPTHEVTIEGCEEGIAYEAIVAANNHEGWSDVSPPSAPTCIGELKPRAKPPMPAPPKLEALGGGKLRVSWSVPQACPPVEATQVQITDVSAGMTLVVDASSGRLMPSGRNFAANRTEVTITGAEDGVEYVAAVSCRNAEGFGEYSLSSDSVANPKADLSSMQLVLHVGPTSEVPVIEPVGEGKMKIRWVLPDGAKSTMVKLRRVGDFNWYLCGGTAVPEPAEETIASGVEEGIEYEAMTSFLISGRWCCESAISRPACIGDKKTPSIPTQPKEPRLLVAEQGDCQMKVRWQTFTAVPSLTGAVVRFRAVGARTWQYVHPTTWQVSAKEPEPVPLPAVELPVAGLETGVRYEACVAFRNKLGQGPFSAPSNIACIGQPAPKLVKCTYCFADYDLQHAEYTKSADNFWCPVCRFKSMDPFNAVVEPYGMLLCHIVNRNVISFSMDLSDLKSWRKDDQDVWMRMVKVDADNCAQIWPRKITFEANGAEVFCVKEPEEGHVRRDVPMNISAGLKAGINTISIAMEDEHIAGYALSLVRTQALTAQQIAEQIPPCPEEQAKARFMTLLADTWSTPLDGDDNEEVTCVISNKLKLRCPLSFERVVIPVRGETCMHLQCFGLQAYLESNMKMRALNNRWTCPVCGNVLKPSDLRIDGYVDRVLSETPSHVDEVLIMQDGSYRVIEESPEDKARREAHAAKAAAAAAGGDTSAVPRGPGKRNAAATRARARKGRAAAAAAAGPAGPAAVVEDDGEPGAKRARVEEVADADGAPPAGAGAQPWWSADDSDSEDDAE